MLLLLTITTHQTLNNCSPTGEKIQLNKKISSYTLIQTLYETELTTYQDGNPLIYTVTIKYIIQLMGKPEMAFWAFGRI